MSEADARGGKQLALARQFFRIIPHGAVLGLEPLEVGDGWIVARLPYKEELVGNPETGVMHGGVITTLVDQTSGAAVVAALQGREAVVTLDLRIDHLRRAEPRRAVHARGECYRVTPSIAFARCVVYQDDPSSPVATSMSTFMRIGGEGPSMVEGAD